MLCRRAEARRSVYVPLFWYLAVTLEAPFANGAFRDPGFWEHAGVVFIVSSTVALLCLLAGRTRGIRCASSSLKSRGHGNKVHKRGGEPVRTGGRLVLANDSFGTGPPAARLRKRRA